LKKVHVYLIKDLYTADSLNNQPLITHFEKLADWISMIGYYLEFAIQ